MKEWLRKVRSMKKDQILILLLLGILLLVIAWPVPDDSSDSLSASVGLESLGSTLTDTEAATVNANVSGEIATGTNLENQAASLEARLETILSQVEGVGDTQVMITLKSSGKKVVEKDTEQSDSKTETIQESESTSSSQSSGSETTIYEKDSDGNETPFVTEEMEPEILGVLVIAQGADSATTVTAITEAVMALFGIDAHKIKVMKME